eukprot:s601_g18.t1
MHSLKHKVLKRQWPEGRTRLGDAMQTGYWLTSLAIDAQRARIAILPHTADSPIIMQTLVLFASCLLRWVFMESTPIASVCPHLVLLAQTLDRVAIPTYGAQILSDTGYLDRPRDLSPAILANEMEQIRADLHALTQPLTLWRRRTPEHLCSAFDRVTMAVLRASEEFLYFEAAPLLTMINEHLTRLQDLMTHAHLHEASGPPAFRISVTPTAGSDGAPMTTMPPSVVAETTHRLLARALADSRNDGDMEAPDP